MSELPPTGGPVRAARRTRAPRRRSSAGPLAFVLFTAVALGGLALYARPLVLDAIVDAAASRESLLRQPLVRGLVAARVGTQADTPADVRGEIRSFEVKRGATVTAIADDLASQGFVRSSLAFTYVVYEAGREDALQAGTYHVSAAMTPRELAKIFERAPSDQAVLKIIEGWRLTEIASTVSKVFPNVTKEAFAAAAVVGDRKNAVLLGLDPKTSLEGFLFPDTYFLHPDASAKEIVDTLLDNFEQKASPALRTASNARKTTVYDLVKLASIVEREARDREESPTIAGVYANRLRIGMKLDADPAVQYALGDWRELSTTDLAVDSPYNTYKVAGLPPTPICNPGLKALEAAANPASHDYLFFVARQDGSGDHLFARTIEEQEANRVKVGNR